MIMLEFRVLFQKRKWVYFIHLCWPVVHFLDIRISFGFTEDILNSIRQTVSYVLSIIVIIHAMLLNDLRVNKYTAILAMCVDKSV